MKVFGIIGRSGSGKTTLIERLLPVLAGQGLSVSTIKQAHPAFDADTPGKDSWRHREAGAREVLVATSRRWALLRERRRDDEVGLDELLPHLEPVDLVLVEGFRAWPHPRLVVHRPSLGRPLEDDPQMVALASNEAVPDLSGRALTVPLLPLDDAPTIAAFILTHCRLRP